MQSLRIFLVCMLALPAFCSFTEKEITPQFLHTLFQPYFEKDEALKQYVAHFPFENYKIYRVENRDYYYVDDISDLIKSQFIRRGVFYEVHVFEKLWRYTKPGTIAVDVGGHIGTHTLNLSRLVKSGTVHVFEPQLKLFVELVINMRLNNVTNVIFHRNALGNEERMVEMNPYNSNNEGGVGIGSGGELVKMERLDTLKLSNISIIKVDVEGTEMEVLDGAKETILRNKPVMVFEIMGGTFYSTATQEQRKEIHRRMKKIEELGYRVYPIGLHDYLCFPKSRSNRRFAAQ